eukprot:141861-Amorphochlora_amoeboformis.AAC.1
MWTVGRWFRFPQVISEAHQHQRVRKKRERERKIESRRGRERQWERREEKAKEEKAGTGEEMKGGMEKVVIRLSAMM